MHCPFPGMDPYIEYPGIWPDFHDRLIAEISGVLQPNLRPKYAALVQDRLYVVQSERPIFPDVAIVKKKKRQANNGGTATMEVAKPIVFALAREEIRRPYIEIVETGAGNRLVTTIEVLSPDNKTTGTGRKYYL